MYVRREVRIRKSLFQYFFVYSFFMAALRVPQKIHRENSNPRQRKFQKEIEAEILFSEKLSEITGVKKKFFGVKIEVLGRIFPTPGEISNPC